MFRIEGRWVELGLLGMIILSCLLTPAQAPYHWHRAIPYPTTGDDGFGGELPSTSDNAGVDYTESPPSEALPQPSELSIRAALSLPTARETGSGLYVSVGEDAPDGVFGLTTVDFFYEGDAEWVTTLPPPNSPPAPSNPSSALQRARPNPLKKRSETIARATSCSEWKVVPVVHSLQEYWSVYSDMLRVMLSLAILYVWTFSKGEYPRASRPRFAECIRCISTTALWAWGVYTTAVSAHVCYGAPTEFNLTHRHLPVAVAFASCFESFLALVAIAHCEKKAPIPKINKVATAVNSFFSFALCVFSIAGLGELLCEEVDFGVYILFLILSTLCRGFIVDWSAGLLGLRDNPEVRLQDMPGVGSRLIEGMKWAWGLRRRLRSPIAPECTAQEAEHEAARGLGGVGGAGDGTDTIDEAGEGNVVDTGVQMDEEPVQETADVASQTDPVVLVDELSQTDAVAVMDEASQTDNWFIKASRLRSATWPGQ